MISSIYDYRVIVITISDHINLFSSLIKSMCICLRVCVLVHV